MDRAKKRAIFQSIGVLAVIALVCGVLLGAVNALTWVDPRTEAYAKFAADTGLSFTVPEEDDTQGRETAFTATVSSSGGTRTVTAEIEYYGLSDDGTVHAFCISGSGGYGGDVQMYVYIRGGMIYKIVAGENSETFMDSLAGSDTFYAQFLNVPVSELLDGSGTDYVSGATRSSNAVTAAVGAAAKYYELYLAEAANG